MAELLAEQDQTRAAELCVCANRLFELAGAHARVCCATAAR
jgi:hypothetical protein